MLEKKDIRLSDTDEHQESISLLIGANVVGKIFTNKVLQINQGIMALETKLGWTILSKDIDDNRSTDTTLTIISMFTQEANITDL